MELKAKIRLICSDCNKYLGHDDCWYENNGKLFCKEYVNQLPENSKQIESVIIEKS